MKVFYSQLAEWWPLLSPVEDYDEEAGAYQGILEIAHPEARTLLELGSGGGHNAYHLKRRYTLTLTDLSEEMLAMSAKLNPECTHVAGDMRTLRLGRTFDAVFVHDAIDYMTTETDLAAAIATAYAHCAPDGVALFAPDVVQERFLPDTECGGTDAEDGRGIRYLEWSYDPDPDDTEGTAQYAFVVREQDGTVRTYTETHAFGLFPLDTWTRLLEAPGFTVEILEEETQEDRDSRLFFLCRRVEAG